MGIKGPAVSDAIKRIEGRLEKESQLRESMEFLKGRILPEFSRFDRKVFNFAGEPASERLKDESPPR